MEVARKKYSASSHAFWIDAICINQQCEPEKAHQVSQMSRIYPGAEEVIGWLGFSQRVERAFTFWGELNTLQPRTYHETHNIWHNHINSRNKELRKDWNELAEQDYWRRAWITQEILLARKFKLLVGESEIEPRSIPGIAQLLPDRSSSNTSNLVSTQIFHTYLENLCGTTEMMGVNLISLLRMLPRDSTNPRDLIISLLSIASINDSVIVACSKSNEDMLLDLLEIFAETLCPCITSYLINALELQITPEIFIKSTQEIPLFSFSTKTADFLPTFLLELDDQMEHCTQCGSEGIDLEIEWTGLCMGNFSGCTRGSHLYLSRKHIAEGETNHIVKTGHGTKEFKVRFVEENGLENNSGGYSLYFTADVLVNLFHSLQSSSWDDKSICTGPHPSRTHCRVQRVSEPETCCALKSCEEDHPSMDILAGYELPGPSMTTRHLWHSQGQLGDWSAASTVKRFFEDPAPWVPGYVRDPLPHAAFSDLAID
ncbi:hypothetical protein yc1106_04843 [Curvularia clavata]|uniref:Heterokaryon incompatibility domain-containing protein n=1 Tax=Curvularia clavata TaxID=95742 RepID=A0A9Q8Z9X3_CURCL|nr:hypothetical protein yc1106_04843 [Curvularia clavata]